MTARLHATDAAPSDHELLAQIAAGRLEALGTLFERHEPGLRRYLGRLGVGASDADDLVQASFLEAARAAARFDPSGSARSWLFGIATLMARRHRRSLSRAAARLAVWAGVARGAGEACPNFVEQLEHEAALRSIARALERLSTKKREVFVLLTLEGLRGEEAAAALGIPLKTVWTRLHHARRELRAALREDER